MQTALVVLVAELVYRHLPSLQEMRGSRGDGLTKLWLVTGIELQDFGNVAVLQVLQLDG